MASSSIRHTCRTMTAGSPISRITFGWRSPPRLPARVEGLARHGSVERATSPSHRHGFVKTSRGRSRRRATLPVTLCMLVAIRDVFGETGRRVGFQAAGEAIRPAGGAAPGARRRDPPAGVDDQSELVPDRRVLAAQRHPVPLPQGTDRHLSVDAATTARRLESTDRDQAAQLPRLLGSLAFSPPMTWGAGSWVGRRAPAR